METTKTLNVKTERIDPSIENANPENCNLSILFKQDGLIFSILRNDINKYIVLGEYSVASGAESLPLLFGFYHQLEGSFLNLNLAYCGNTFTLLPAPLFSKYEAAAYAQSQFVINADEVFRIDELPTHQLVILYTVPRAVDAFVAANFGQHTLRHSTFFTISYFLDAYKNKPGEHFHANFWQQSLEVLAVSNARLTLCSRFIFESNEDVAYYILNCYEQLGLNPETVPLKVSGEIEKGSKAWTILEKFIRFVELETRPASQYSHEFKSLPNHQYNRIFQTAQCAS